MEEDETLVLEPSSVGVEELYVSLVATSGCSSTNSHWTELVGRAEGGRMGGTCVKKLEGIWQEADRRLYRSWCGQVHRGRSARPARDLVTCGSLRCFPAQSPVLLPDSIGPLFSTGGGVAHAADSTRPTR